MILSKEDLFADGVSMASGNAVTTDVLDFGEHGDDVSGNLYYFVHVSGAAGVTCVWQTSDTEAFSAPTVLETKTGTGAAGGAFAIQPTALPRGLKRYNRLSITVSAAVNVTAGLTDGRSEEPPFKG